MGPFEVLRMHTLGSAEVLGIDKTTGSLSEGKKADFLMIDARSFRPYQDPYAALVFAAGVENIDGVFIDGLPVAIQRHLVNKDVSADSSCKPAAATVD
ncbi:5'-deoxyadenosine deaminase [compost metagenome]